MKTSLSSALAVMFLVGFAAEAAAQNKCAGFGTEVAGRGLTCIDPAKPNQREFQDCKDGFCGPKMVALPTGDYLQGSEFDVLGERGPVDGTDRRKVTIGYYLGVAKFEVTWAEWEACVAAKVCINGPVAEIAADESWGKDKRPVIKVSWNDAKTYTGWLAKKTGQPYRLLTEAEWEYAARGVRRASARHTWYSFGDTITEKQARFSSDRTVEVGSFPANPFGLHDMHGNVSEWVEDCRGDNYKDAPADGTARTSGNCSQHVIRGGAWNDFPSSLRSHYRRFLSSDYRVSIVGFRVARMLSQ